MSINLVEGFWLALSLGTGFLTLLALIQAYRDWGALKRFNGSARGVVARSNIFGEWMRLYVQIVFLALVIPAAFREGDTPLTPTLVLFLSVPVAIFANTVNTRRVRGILAHKLLDEIVKERETSMARLERKIDENTAITNETAHRIDERVP